MLLQKGLDLQERDFFKEQFSEAEIRDLSASVGVSQLFARRSPSLNRMGLAGREPSDDQMLALMLEEPRLIRRPLVRIGGRLLVGANPKAVETALQRVG